MRVIAGEFRSRRLKSLPGLDTRPTSDRMRETLFNILGVRVDGALFLDAYAGTGAVGIEALSRGAARAIFIERSRAAVAVIRENLAALELTSRAEVFTGKTLDVLPRLTPAIAFLDPPYERDKEYPEALELLGSAAPKPLVVVQHSVKLKLLEAYGTLHQYRQVKQGDNVLSFFE